MTILFRVDLGCVGWQPFYDDLRMLLQILGDLHPLMNRRTIPNQDPSARNMAAQMFQGFNDFFASHRTFKMAFEDLARNRQPNRGRKNAPLFGHSSQQRTFATWSPGPSQRREERKAGLVKQHDFRPNSTCLFLSGTSLGVATPRLIRHRALWHAAMETEVSSPVGATNDSSSWDDTSP